jgi:exodeoxyribonuclease-1
MQPIQTFLWHDYETFGTDPFADRPAQFAAIRTDAELQPVGEPIDWFCAPANDTLPHPGACLVTGITPQRAQAHGVCEAEFARRVNDEMAEPGTCIVGYNSHRFDDVFTRNLFYRNFFDPYRHEYSNGNSRWDLIDLLRMCFALRPEGVHWPMREDDTPSFRLEELTAANGIAHQDAHDALGDVRATIAMATLLRQRQRRLFDWGLGLRDQQAVQRMLNPADPQPVLHTSAKIAAARGCTSLVLPVATHPHIKKSVIVFDLMTDPEPLIRESADQLHDRVFTPARDLPEDVERLPLKEIKTNGSPMLAPPTTLKGVDCGRIGLDPERCYEHARRIRAEMSRIGPKVMDIYAHPPLRDGTDPDLQIYSGGFFSHQDKRLMDRIRATPPAELGLQPWRFQDARLPEMLFRYRARNYPETLNPEEAQRWETDRLERLRRPPDDRLLGLEQFELELAQARQDHQDNARAQAMLDQLQAWALALGLE